MLFQAKPKFLFNYVLYNLSKLKNKTRIFCSFLFLFFVLPLLVNVNVGKSVRRRAASMETSKYEKRRGRVKKQVENLKNSGLTGKSISGNIFIENNNKLSRKLGTTRLHMLMIVLK